ncbi:MAG: hypothetical protein EA384_06695 [Spirochaetaceae bacterium]|nr:MAG: hypothetical protein EA384_06695 [Spirochaetaceae bacterium]
MSRALPGLQRFGSRLLRAYGAVLRAAGGVAAVAVATAAIAVIGVYPLWLLATRARQVYTVAVGTALLALLLLLLYKKARRIHEAVRHGEVSRGLFVRRARTAAAAIIVLALGYAAAVLVVHGNLVAAGSVAVMLLLAVGLLVGRRNGTDADSN